MARRARIIFSGEGDDATATNPVAILKSLYDGATELVLNREPDTPAEKAYMLLFESFKPSVRVDSGAAVAAASAASAATATYPLKRIAPPLESRALLPVTGEYIQGLCEKTVLTRKHYRDIEPHILSGDSADRLYFIEGGFSAELLETTRSIFLYPIPEAIEPALAQTWPALKLVVIHSGDNTVPASIVASFLERHPAARVWQVNMCERVGPRAKPLPLLEQNRYWRGGSSKEDDPPVECRREGAHGRDGSIFCTWRWETHPRRRELFYEVAAVASERPDIALYRYLDKEDYEEGISKAAAVLTPPGNGFDTHRCWEALYRGAWPILMANEHTRLLVEEYPSLPCLVIRGAEELRELVVPPCPSLFHPMLLREYWRVQYGGVMAAGGHDQDSLPRIEKDELQ